MLHERIDIVWIHVVIVIENPSEYEITVKVMIENSENLCSFLGATYENKFEKVHLKPFERIEIK